jgi:hypothetical protein
MRTLARISIVFSAACVSPAENDATLGTTAQAVETHNGESLNGESLNGESLNGESLNGESLNGPYTNTFSIWTSLQGATLDGNALDSVSLYATRFSGTIGWDELTAESFVGVQFDTMRADGEQLKTRIAAVVPHENATGYFVEYRWNGRWLPACRDSSGNPVEAYPLNGTWDHNQGTPTGGSHTDDPTRFTFACRGLGALAKCIDIGYRPWETPEHHLACVRMLRADYCRNGTPYTTNGRLINVYDAIGIQEDVDEWPLDAAWDSGGARCFTSHNRASTAVPCFDPTWDQTCGAATFDSGTLIIDELP